MGHRCSSRPGFTLIEILIAISIVAALVSLAVPMLRARGPEARLMEVSERIRHAVVQARDRSQREGGVWQVRVTAAGSYDWRVTASRFKPEPREDEQTPTLEASDEGLWLLLLPDGGAVVVRELLLSAEKGRTLQLDASPITADVTTHWVEKEAAEKSGP